VQAEQNRPETRNNLIENELNCVSQNMNQNEGITWDDVCYVSDYSAINRAKRDKTVNNALDRFENKLKVQQKQNYKFKPYPPQQAQRIPAYPRKPAYPSYQVHAQETDGQKSLEIDYASSTAKRDKSLVKVKVQLLSGYRHDDFFWNIAGDINGKNPNILSELTWDLKMKQTKIKADITIDDHFVIDGKAAYSDIFSGENQDSDYLGDDRTLEFLRSNSQADDGEILDLTGGLGYKMSLATVPDFFLVDEMTFTFLGGYSYSEQHLIMTDGVQTIPSLGPFPGLHHNYDTEWEGPWVGFNLEGVRDNLAGYFRFQYHWLDYFAQANWNLRTDFAHPVSFEHFADGRGIEFEIGGDYRITDNWILDFNAEIKDYETFPGIDRTFFASGAVIDTQLNEVKWDVYAFMFGATYEFF